MEDILATVKTNNKGEFSITGDTSTLAASSTEIDPHLRIYHKCSKKNEEKDTSKVFYEN